MVKGPVGRQLGAEPPHVRQCCARQIPARSGDSARPIEEPLKEGELVMGQEERASPEAKLPVVAVQRDLKEVGVPKCSKILTNQS